MLELVDTKTTPHGKWSFTTVSTGHTSGPFYSYDQLQDAVYKHWKANGISTPLGWKWGFQDELCRQGNYDCKETDLVHEDEAITIMGRALWVELHEFTANYPDVPNKNQQEHAAQWLNGWISRIPSFNRCSCRKDFDAWYAIFPAPLHSGEGFSKWAEIMHDRVNQKLQRPLKNKENANHPVFMV